MDCISMCRVCLKTSSKYINFETLYEPVDQHDNNDECRASALTYLDCFRACTQLNALANEDNMPQSICETCSFELVIAYGFLRKALRAHKVLAELNNPKLEEPLLANSESGDSFEADGTVMNVEYLVEEKDSECNEDLDVDLRAVKQNSNDSEFEGEDNTLTEAEDFVKEVKNESVYMCSVCHECFNSEVDLNVHWKKAHEAVKLDVYSYEYLDETDPVEKSLSNEENYEVLEVNESGINEEYDSSNSIGDKKEEIVKGLRQNTDAIEEIENQHDVGPVVLENVAINSEDGTLRCSACGRDFNTERAFLIHWKMHKPNMRSICKICNEPLQKSESMREHHQRIHSEVVQCSKCDFKCKESKLPEHERRVHVARRTNFTCNICSKAFTSHSMLKTHLKYHQRKEANIKSDACHICGKQFSTQHYLRQHIEVHRNERQLHQCEYCEKIYVSKTALDNHVRMHKGETTACPVCGKQFARQYELNVHMRFHTRDYPFECELCGRKFAIKGHLRTHMWRHQGLKLQCEECGKLFTSTKALQEHSFVHSEMPFRCSYCDRGYPSKQKFKVHLRTTHLIELNEEELQKVTKNQAPKPLQRKKLTLVQADSVMKEVEVKEDGGNESVEEFLVELC